MDYRPVFYIIGILLSILSLSMVIPLAIDLYYGNRDWVTFFTCILFTGFFGGALILSNRVKQFHLGIRQAFMLTGASWIILAFFSALPFYFSAANLSYTDSFFEAVSGITTTGSTIMTGLDQAPPGILMWRALLQWLGGIGIVVMALSVLPFLKVGGMQLFRTESSENEKAMPRAAQLAASISIIYFFLTLLCALSYAFAGLKPFDAVAHAMTTIATGGFSTFDSSFSGFDTAWPDIVAITFMTLGALPFILYLKAVNGNVRALLADSQIRIFLYIVLGATLALAFYLMNTLSFSLVEALRRSAFNVLSIITGTGYTNGNYNLWGGFAIGLLFFLTFVGGCAGSTSCGIKIFRFQVLFEVTTLQIKKLLHPHGVFLPHYNKKAVSEDIYLSVMGFFFVYILCFVVLGVALSFVGLDFITAMSGAATAISNVGPGLGDIIGPFGTFAPLPDTAKWILCIGMILGRLEIFTVMILFTPSFWRK